MSSSKVSRERSEQDEVKGEEPQEWSAEVSLELARHISEDFHIRNRFYHSSDKLDLDEDHRLSEDSSGLRPSKDQPYHETGFLPHDRRYLLPNELIDLP